MKKFLSIISIILLAASGAEGQQIESSLAKPKDIEQIQIRKLIVITEAPDDKVIEDLRKNSTPRMVEMYKEGLVTYNENMKAVAEKFWPWASNGIEYKTYDEVRELRKKGNKDYVVLRCHVRWEDGMNQQGYLKSFDKQNIYSINCSMEVTLLEKFGKAKPVGWVRLPAVLPNKMSLILGLTMIEQYCCFQAPGKMKIPGATELAEAYETSRKNVGWIDHRNLKTCQGKTLYIRKDLLGVTESVLKEYYPYPFKICTREELDDMYMNHMIPPKSCVLLGFPQDDSHYYKLNKYCNMYIYDMNTSSFLTFVGYNTTELTEEDLMYLTKKK